MADLGRRSVALWLGLGTVAAVDLYLYYHAKEHEDEEIEEENPEWGVGENPPLVRRVSQPPSLGHKLLLALRSVSLYSLLGSLVALEISHIYFGDHTIFGALLSASARKLSSPYLPRLGASPSAAVTDAISPPWRLRIARKVLVAALWWEKLWLSKRHILLLPIYAQLIELVGLMRDSNAAKHYSRAMATLRARERRKFVVETAQKTLEFLKMVRARIQDFRKRHVVANSAQTIKSYVDRLPWR